MDQCSGTKIVTCTGASPRLEQVNMGLLWRTGQERIRSARRRHRLDAWGGGLLHLCSQALLQNLRFRTICLLEIISFEYRRRKNPAPECLTNPYKCAVHGIRKSQGRTRTEETSAKCLPCCAETFSPPSFLLPGLIADGEGAGEELATALHPSERPPKTVSPWPRT
jgi:hypothetical protein